MDSEEKKPFGLDERALFGSGASNLKQLRKSFQGVRHLVPKNLSPLRAQLEKQLTNLREVNQLAAVKPPFVHRPGQSRYVNPSIVRTDDSAGSEKP